MTHKLVPIGWLIRGGGDPKVKPIEAMRWEYRHGAEEPFLAWEQQEKMPVFAAPQPDRIAELEKERDAYKAQAAELGESNENWMTAFYEVQEQKNWSDEKIISIEARNTDLTAKVKELEGMLDVAMGVLEIHGLVDVYERNLNKEVRYE